MQLLSVQQVSCRKSDHMLFEQVSFSVNAGDILHIRGDNGVGKTSLLRILAGLSRPASGNLVYSQATDNQPACLYFGHKSGLNLHLSVVENLTYWLQIQGLTLKAFELDQVLEWLGLGDYHTTSVGKLSAGQQRRAALARFYLGQQIPLWLMDEPFTALDVDGSAQVATLLQQHAKQGGAVILTSHQALNLQVPVTELYMEASE